LHATRHAHKSNEQVPMPVNLKNGSNSERHDAEVRGQLRFGMK
jgi:hypothetical protein